MNYSVEHTFKKPRTNTTGNQVRKHATQMTKGEKQRCVDNIRTGLYNNGIKLHKHVKDRKTIVNLSHVMSTFYSEDLINNILEYNERLHTTGIWTARVLVHIPIVTQFYCSRRKKVVDGYLKVVYDINTGDIITAYYNDIHDTHSTLNTTLYTKEMLIRKYQEGGFKDKNKGVHRHEKKKDFR